MSVQKRWDTGQEEMLQKLGSKSPEEPHPADRELNSRLKQKSRCR